MLKQTLLLVLIAVIVPCFSALKSSAHAMRRSSVLSMARGFGNVSKFQYSGALRPGVQTPRSIVPKHINCPDYAIDGVPKASKNSGGLKPQTTATIEKMRVAGRLAREVLDEAVRLVRPGITTDSIDKLVHEETIKRNAYPSPLNYSGYPKSCCTSINEVICHGIPDSTILKNGDIVNIDVTLYHDGVHGDCSETVLVGEVSDQVKDLVRTTHDSLQAAMAICKPGARYNEIGGVIEDVVRPKGYRSVKVFCGHGINTIFHDFPNVLHYKNTENLGIMAEGHTFTIEPMISLGSVQPLLWPDKWTATTSDGSWTAQFEHTLVVTSTGVEALTGKLPTSPKFFWEK